ncbi:MAG: hypothetical protein ABMA64_27920, partial [Myxococcota bacterium]
VLSGPGNSTTFTASGRVGGQVNIIAGYQGTTTRRTVLVQLSGSQNGVDPNSPEQQAQVPLTIAQLTAGGGVGGVGGEGLGPALANADPNLVALGGTPTANASLKLIYPYDATVWPRGMLAPLLQWDWATGDADAVQLELTTTTTGPVWSKILGEAERLPTTADVFAVYGWVEAWDGAPNAESGRGDKAVRLVEWDPLRPDAPVLDLDLWVPFERLPDGIFTYRAHRGVAPLH